MDYSDKHYIIGIDLGTTNTVVSYVDLKSDRLSSKSIKLFTIPQLTGAGEITRHSVLPSFLYIPGKYDIDQKSIKHPWKTKEKKFAGLFARNCGGKVPARLVSSAKSWLCHGNVDRKAKILPWGSNDEVDKVSPVYTTSAYLEHIKKSWNYLKGDDESLYLENQIVIVTVPASFDEVARDLTVEAANKAGIKNITLIEEPLAAFYRWMVSHENNWSDYVNPDELILVCDVGGGTTDFTLIALSDVEGGPHFERIAVGDHLILGGDNMDFAIARMLESKFKGKKSRLSGDRWKMLCHQCRQAKENIFSKEKKEVKITLVGEGSSFIGGTMSATIKKDFIYDTIVDGFFPFVDTDIGYAKKSGHGISEIGLPYEQEPAITYHLNWFLKKHGKDVEKILGKKPFPHLILFNGGALKPAFIQERIRGVVSKWFGNEDESLPKILENSDHDLSVAMGAAYYGLVKLGKGVRVGSGSARSYYLGINAEKECITKKGKKAVCIVERGLNEGADVILTDREFEVLTNQLVSFDVYSSSYRSGDRHGDVVNVDNSMSVLPSIQTVIKFGKKGIKTALPVKIEVKYTEIGTILLWCKSLSSSHRWQLQFQLRGNNTALNVAEESVLDDSVVAAVKKQINEVFLEISDSETLDLIVKKIVDIVELRKDKWPLGFIRNISDELIKQIDTRLISSVHESRWLNLTGYCMRPGFGNGFDEQRIKNLWKIYKKGPEYSKNVQSVSEWWVMWRRVAGGLKPGHQRQFSQDLTPLLIPKKGGSISRLSPQEMIEMWMAIANMEYLLIKDKIKWGRYFLSCLKPKKSRPQHFWALSRIGARELLYGSADRVVPPDEVEKWIETILSMEWKNYKPVLSALIHMARKTGDRTRDIRQVIIEKILDKFSQHNISQKQQKSLKEVIPIKKQEETAIFGESLPSGIIIKQ